MIDYYRYIKSRAWKEFSRRVRKHWGNRCAICNKDGLLEVHHRTYERLGHETMTDVIPLCPECHQMHSPKEKPIRLGDVLDKLLKGVRL